MQCKNMPKIRNMVREEYNNISKEQTLSDEMHLSKRKISKGKHYKERKSWLK
jgi:hypothetical protein